MSCSVSFFLLHDIKQDSVTANAHIKRLIEHFFLVLMYALSTIWENADGFAEQYICVSEL